jgi:hypothetical protein
MSGSDNSNYISSSPQCGNTSLRPILHHLNADSSWLLQIPRPPGSVNVKRSYFNVLLDPWLQGPQSDIARWFSQQWHAEESAAKTIADVEALAKRAESHDNIENRQGDTPENGEEDATSPIDVVAISHEFTDHCHRETLLEISSSVPVFAPKKAAALVLSWKHFQTVVEMPLFQSSRSDWRALSMAPLPSWLSISRVMDEKDALYYHSAVMIAWGATATGSETYALQAGEEVTAECVLYTPHGVTDAAALPLLEAKPPVQTLCLIHGLHDVTLKMTQQLNLGAHNGLKVQRALKPKYWFGTHDEVKKAGGIIKLILRRKIITLEDAVRQAKETLKPGDEVMDDIVFEYVGNGESRTLT